MIGKAERKEAAREFKEIKASAGVYALRCSVTGRRWIEVSPNLKAAENRELFVLRQRLHRNRELQAEWNAHGEASFSFEVLEVLPEDIAAINLRDVLAERKRVLTEESHR